MFSVDTKQKILKYRLKLKS